MKRIFGLLALLFTLGMALPAMADAADSLPAGFIAIAPDEMTWDAAKAYCEQHGGRLPLIGNSNSLGSVSVSKGTLIDGFGSVGASWPPGLPGVRYWTGTVNSDFTGYSWGVHGYGDDVGVFSNDPGHAYRVVCVP